MLVHGDPNTTLPLALLALVVIVIYLRVLFYFIQDLYKPERRVYGSDKTIWLFIILFGSILGCLAYLYFGRQD